METLFIAAFITLGAHLGFAQPIATSEVIRRVFLISYPDTNKLGTCFVIDVSNRQYLVTAKHVVAGISSNAVVRIFHDSEWKDLGVRRLDCPNTNADIAVLIPNRILCTGHVEVGSDGLFVGQDVVFLGFPYGLFTDGKINNNFPIPFVKRAMVSGLGPSNQFFWLDGINNPGFSGGPVVVYDEGSKRRKIIAVISGFLNAEEAVQYHGQKTDLISVNNTGLIKCWDIDNALEAIKNCPEGPIIK